MMRRITNLILAVACSLALAQAALAAQVANYEFQGDLGSSGGAPSLVDLGDGSFATESPMGQECTVFQFAEQTGLSLDVSGLLGSGPYSFVATVRLAETEDWAKLLDIHDRVLDEGLYAHDNTLEFYAYDTYEIFPLFDEMWATVVLTYDGTMLRGYVNGVETFAVVDENQVGSISADTLYFFRDDFDTSDSENTAGAVANIQLHDRALTAGEVASMSFACNANQGDFRIPRVPTLGPAGLSALILLLALIGATVAARRFS